METSVEYIFRFFCLLFPDLNQEREIQIAKITNHKNPYRKDMYDDAVRASLHARGNS